MAEVVLKGMGDPGTLVWSGLNVSDLWMQIIRKVKPRDALHRRSQPLLGPRRKRSQILVVV